MLLSTGEWPVACKSPGRVAVWCSRPRCRRTAVCSLACLCRRSYPYRYADHCDCTQSLISSSAEARLFPLRVRIADRLIWQVGEDLPVPRLWCLRPLHHARLARRKEKKKLPPTQQTRSAVRSRWSLAARCWGYYSTDSPARVIAEEPEESSHTKVQSRATVGTHILLHDLVVCSPST